MSWKKANAAGAKHQARAAEERESNPHKSIGGKCMFTGCTSPATFQKSKLKVCRDHKDWMES